MSFREAFFGGRVRTRLAVQVVLLTSLLLGGLIPFLLNWERDAILERYKSRALEDTIGVMEVLETEMMTGDRETLRPRLTELTGSGSPERVRVFDREGTLMVSSSPHEEGIRFSTGDPSCQVCHERTPELRSRTIVSGEGGGQVFRSVHPIRNKPNCMEGGETGCHSTEHAYNGILIADYPMAGFLRERRWLLIRLALYILGGAAVVAVVGSVTVSGVFLKPLKNVDRALEALGRGDFSVRVPESGGAEMKSLARTLNQMSVRLQHLIAERQQAEQAGKLAALGEVTAEFAHDIGSSLDGAMECLKMLRDVDRAGEKGDKYVKLALGALERVEFMAKNLMLLGSHRPVKLTDVDVNELVSRALQFVSPRVERRGIDVELRFQEETVGIRTDRDGVTQVLINLLFNALDALGGKGGRLLVATGPGEEGGAWIRIEDSGPGVDPGLARNIFEPFFTTKEEGRGTGLGLTIARKVIDEIGGTLTLADGELGGAAFLIRLPSLEV